MDKIITSISSLLWPLIVILVIIIFRPYVATIIESARSRKFTIKIGGQELTMEEANGQQRKYIADLQDQITKMNEKISLLSVNEKILSLSVNEKSHLPDTSILENLPDTSPLGNLPKSILWVDDHPKNNSYFVEQLGEIGTSVDLALSTNEGIYKFQHGRYQAIISDMGRQEDGKYKPDAGMDLLRLVREIDTQIPYIIFSTRKGIRDFGKKARELGVTKITSSPTELYGILNINEKNNRS